MKKIKSILFLISISVLFISAHYLPAETFKKDFDTKLFNDGKTASSVREQAKTTFDTSIKLRFKTVKEFRTYLNKAKASDAVMSKIKIKNKQARLPQEKVFVTIEKAYLYQFSVEEDNDIHLIFGDSKKSVDLSTSMNGEISALPVLFKKDKAAILKVRKKAIELLSDYKKCNGTTEKSLYIPIRVSGSIFYDSHHKSKHAECGCCATSNTAWEIHPIFSFEILE